MWLNRTPSRLPIIAGILAPGAGLGLTWQALAQPAPTERIEIVGDSRYTYHDPVSLTEVKNIAHTEAIRMALDRYQMSNAGMGEERDGLTGAREAGLHDARLALEPADILDDLLHIVGADPFDFGHVAELPMVGADAVGRCPLESHIAVMIGLVDLVHQRRPLGGPHATIPMAASAVGLELGFAFTELRRNRRRVRLRPDDLRGGQQHKTHTGIF